MRNPNSSRRGAGLYIARAIKLRCPECGVSPLFKPVAQTRTLHDWFSPLPGCPRCDYAYNREQGYFLLATWGVHYFTVTGFGLVVGLLLEHFLPYDLWIVLVLTVIPTAVLALLFARHAKSIYLAADHYLDPHDTIRK